MKKLILKSLPVALLTVATAAHADDVPNNTLRAGLYEIFYHVSAADLQGPFVPAGVNLDVKNTQTAYFAYIRRLNESFDVELAFGIPPKTKTVGKGPATLG